MKLFFYCLFLICIYAQSNAQLIENFSDGNFNSSPVWAGDTSVFIINNSGQLQLNNAGNSGASYLVTTTPISTLDSLEWKFYLKMSFAGSTSNNVRVYLTADNPDLKTALNGYYVMFGEAGSNDAIELFKQSGTISTSICRGTTAAIVNGANVSVKVQRRTGGNWQLLVDYTGGTNYTLEAQGIEATFNTSNYFGIVCNYTSSNATKIYFDNISIQPIYVDTTAPSIVSATVINATSVDVLFSEVLSTTTANDKNNYFINNGIGLVAQAVQDNTNNALVHLSLNNTLINNSTYQLIVNNIADNQGNNIASNSTISFTYFLIESAKPYDVVINEIMVDPTPIVGLPAYEYVELYNRSDKSITLKKVQLKINSSKTILPDVVIQPKQYLLFIGSSAEQAFAGINNKVVVPTLITLPNDGGILSLNDSLNRVIHTVAYDISWYKNTQKADGGWSLEQIDYNNPCGESTNWKASENIKGGTPGSVNSVKAINQDKEQPRLARVNVKSPTLIEAVFTESLDSATISNTGLFIIDNQIGNPISVKPINPQYKSVNLLLNQELDSSIAYTLTVSNNILDCVGNVIISSYTTARFGIPKQPKAGDILINEILPDPNDGAEEFIELYNKSNKTIDLKYLSFLTFTSTSGALSTVYNCKPDGYLMFPGDYLVLTKKAAGVSKYYSVKNDLAIVETNIPTLTNDAGSVVLGDVNNKELDRLDYTSKMHHPLLNTTKGVTLERISLLKETNHPSNWHSASENSGFGTPTSANSQLIDGGLSKNFTLSSDIFSPDNDGYQDVLAINYTLEQPGTLLNLFIYDGNGNIVKQLVKNELLGTEGVCLWDGTNANQQKVNIGPYVLLLELTNINGTTAHIRKTVVVATKL